MNSCHWQRCIKHPLPVILLATALFTLPLFWHLSPTLDDSDFLFYRLALTEFSAQFWQGSLYPRWLYAANDGLGSPVFVFLGAGAYYPTVLLQWMSGVDPDGTIRFITSISAARVLTGWLCYRWLLTHCSKGQALGVAVIFLFIPYSLHELYVRKELAEQWAAVAMLAFLIGLDRILAGEKTAGACVQMSLASATLILIHLPSYITFGWIPFVYVYFQGREQRNHLFLLLLAMNLWAVLATCYYWLPLILNKEFIHADYYFTGQYTFANNFFRHPNEYYCLPYFVLFAVTFWLLRRELLQSPFMRAQLAIVCIIAFMLTPASFWVWQWVFPLHYLQFPYRFLNVAMFSFAIICLPLLQRRWEGIILMLWLMLIILHGWVIVTFSPRADASLLRLIPDHRLVTLQEYKTRWLAHEDELKNSIFNGERAKAPLIALTSTGEVAHALTHAGIMEADVTMQERGAAIFKHFYFPGLVAEDMLTHQFFPVAPDANYGVASVDLPAGTYHLQLRMGSMAGQREGGAISLLAAAFLGWFWRRRRTVI